MAKYVVTIIWRDGEGNDISEMIESVPGFKDLFMRAYNESTDMFNEHINSVNKAFDVMYPDHKMDMDNPNDLYYKFVSEEMQWICDRLSYKYFGLNPKYRFGYFGEMATFALKIDKDRIVSFTMKMNN